MIIVVDANILFSALIREGLTRAFLLFSDHDFFAPEFSIEEFEKHFPELREKTGLEKEQLRAIFEKLVRLSGLRLVPFSEFNTKEREAEEISPDAGDIAYLALALHLNCPIWSNDKALKKQAKVKILTTKELLE